MCVGTALCGNLSIDGSALWLYEHAEAAEEAKQAWMQEHETRMKWRRSDSEEEEHPKTFEPEELAELIPKEMCSRPVRSLRLTPTRRLHLCDRPPPAFCPLLALVVRAVEEIYTLSRRASLQPSAVCLNALLRLLPYPCETTNAPSPGLAPARLARASRSQRALTHTHNPSPFAHGSGGLCDRRSPRVAPWTIARCT